MGHACFDAVRRDSGDAETVTIVGLCHNHDGEITWSLLGQGPQNQVEVGKSQDGTLIATCLLEKYILIRARPTPQAEYENLLRGTNVDANASDA